jgi:myo-inositol-1(or 4)-monophosphatase
VIPGPELAADRALLERAVAVAGALALEHFRAPPHHWYKGPGQVLTETDLAVDRLLRGLLLNERPGYGWLSEETPDDGSRLERSRVWVVDPIDGTRAFADRVPEFSISAALLVDGTPMLGVVLNPATGERYQATRGEGARLGDRALRVSAQAEVAGARLLSSRTEMKRRRWPEVIPGAAFRTIGSLAYKLALVAAGRFDGLVSLRNSWDWDVAAAHLLLEEAGGRLTRADGSALLYNQAEPRHRGLVAAPALLHGELVERLSRL